MTNAYLADDIVPDESQLNRFIVTLPSLCETELGTVSPERHFKEENAVINEEDLKIQIWLCNRLIGAKQQLARFEWRKEVMGKMEMPSCAGFCTAAARDGDKVIVLPGVARLLIVRETAEPSASTIELVSPAILYQLGTKDMWWSPDEPLDQFSAV